MRNLGILVLRYSDTSANSDLISKIVKINDGVMPSPNAVFFQ